MRYFVEPDPTDTAYYFVVDNEDGVWECYKGQAIHKSALSLYQIYPASEKCDLPAKEVSHSELLEWIEDNWRD